MMRSIKRAAATTGLAAVLAMGAIDIAEAQARRGHAGPPSAHAANRGPGGGPGGGQQAGGGNRPGRPSAGRPSGGGPNHGGPSGGHRPPSNHIDVDVDHNWDRRWDHHDHDVWDAVGTAAAVTATVAVTNAVIGSVTRTLPSSSCVASPYGSLTYYSCGDTWYQPRYYGSNVEYIVVERPY